LIDFSQQVAGMKHVSDDDIASWIFEDSEIEGEFSDESTHEETVPLCSDISSSESESNDQEENDYNTQPVTSSWKVYCHGDGDHIKFLYSVTQQGFTLLKVLSQKPNLNISSSFSQTMLLAKYACIGKITESDSMNRILNVALMEGCFIRRNEGVLWCNAEHGSEFVGAII
jgi:hypothetical protein